jgi:hypothetical protein
LTALEFHALLQGSIALNGIWKKIKNSMVQTEYCRGKSQEQNSRKPSLKRISSVNDSSSDHDCYLHSALRDWPVISGQISGSSENPFMRQCAAHSQSRIRENEIRIIVDILRLNSWNHSIKCPARSELSRCSLKGPFCFEFLFFVNKFSRLSMYLCTLSPIKSKFEKTASTASVLKSKV